MFLIFYGNNIPLQTVLYVIVLLSQITASYTFSMNLCQQCLNMKKKNYITIHGPICFKFVTNM
jgi:hypothetical protein